MESIGDYNLACMCIVPSITHTGVERRQANLHADNYRNIHMCIAVLAKRKITKTKHTTKTRSSTAENIEKIKKTATDTNHGRREKKKNTQETWPLIIKRLNNNTEYKCTSVVSIFIVSFWSLPLSFYRGPFSSAVYSFQFQLIFKWLPQSTESQYTRKENAIEIANSIIDTLVIAINLKFYLKHPFNAKKRQRTTCQRQ